MFYLSKNALSDILSRIYFLRGPCYLPYNTNMSINFLNNQLPIVLLVRDFEYFKDTNIIGIEIYDGSHVKDGYWWTGAILDEKKWHEVEPTVLKNCLDIINPQSRHYNPQNENILTLGSVILVKEFTFENIILKEEKLDNLEIEYYLEDVLKIVDYIIIGKDVDYKNTFNNGINRLP